MRIARFCYAGYLIGSSKRNFEQEILKSVLNGLDVGDINHGSERYSNFMPFALEQVVESIKSFFSSRLDHSGFKPRLISKPIRRKMFAEQNNLHLW